MLREIRKAKNLALHTVADAAEIDMTALSRMENGVRRPPELYVLLKIGTALKLPVTSMEFTRLVLLANKERHDDPHLTDFIQPLLAKKRFRRRTETANESNVVFCDTFAALVASATAVAIDGEAVEIMVRSKHGVVRIFRRSDMFRSPKARE